MLTTQISRPAAYVLLDTDLFTGGEREYELRIRDMAEEDKPREKLMRNGPQALNAAELLAIVLGAGTRKEGVLAMSARILKEYGDKGVAHETDAAKLGRDLVIPATKACQIIAAFELGRRFCGGTRAGTPIIRTAKQAFDYLSDMRALPKEQFRGLYLNSHYRLIHDEVISLGSLTSNVIHPREVFRPALLYAAAAVIVAHNHPSGSTKPSAADLAITAQLAEAGRIMGINVLDHLIIAGNKFTCIPVKYA